MFASMWFTGEAKTDYNEATGGSVTTDGDFKVHTFTSSGTFDLTSVGTVNSDIQLLLVGGGASGGRGYQSGGGGSGAMMEKSGHTATKGEYSIVVGAGGSGIGASSSGTAQSGNDGSDSTGFSITSIGGGGCAGNA